MPLERENSAQEPAPVLGRGSADSGRQGMAGRVVLVGDGLGVTLGAVAPGSAVGAELRSAVPAVCVPAW